LLERHGALPDRGATSEGSVRVVDESGEDYGTFAIYLHGGNDHGLWQV
jgi:hypothetical protein